MILDTIQFIIAWGILLFIVGYFFYKTYQAIRNEPSKHSPSAWKQVEAKVLASRITEQFRNRQQGLEVDVEYTVNGTRYTGTGQTVLYKGENPPITVKLVYKPEAPDAWEWEEDHSEYTQGRSSNRFVIFFLWLTLILIGIGVGMVVYFPGMWEL